MRLIKSGGTPVVVKNWPECSFALHLWSRYFENIVLPYRKISAEDCQPVRKVNICVAS